MNAEYDTIVYWKIRDGVVWHQGRRLRSADPATFEVLAGHDFLGRDRTQVFHAWSKLKAVDRASFEVLTDNYCRDKKLAYCEYETSLKPLKGRTVKDFAVLGGGYARDAGHAYQWGKPLRKCTAPLTLEVVDIDGTPSLYARDANHVYYEGAVLKGAAPDDWRPVTRGFSRDSRNVFFGSKKLPRAQADKWELVEGAYSRDDKSVYVMSFRLKGATPSQWRILDPNYSTDGERVFYIGHELEDVDVASFKVTKKGVAKDKHGAFDGAVRSDD